jgi:hypothetical protein
MIKLRALLAAILTLVVSLAHAETWRDYIEVSSTEFNPGITLSGKPKDQAEATDRYTLVMFASVQKKTGQLIGAGFVVLNTYHSNGWRRWNTAATSQAEPLKLKRDGAERRLCNSAGCFFDESVTIILPLTALRQAATEPMRIRMTGQAPGAEFIFQIDSREAQALLEAIEETGAAQKAGNK